MSTPHRPRLPACRNCYQKKIKTWIARSYIDELETRELASRRPGDRQPAQPDTGPSPEQAPTAHSMTSNANTATESGGGLSFLYLLFSNAEWRRANADVLRALAQSANRRTGQDEIDACPLPSRDTARELFERYLGWSHVLNPLLLRSEVWGVYERVFPAAAPRRGTEHEAQGPDLVRAFLLCAIAAVIPYRTGSHPQHPEGYYRSALQHLDRSHLTRGLDSIQDLLLICRFGIYHHIGTSIWDIVRLCGRLCIENDLHCSDGERGLSLLQAQRRRRIFWLFYHIDRYSSTTLDRPFSIADEDIRVGLPVEATEEALVDAEGAYKDLDTLEQMHLAPTGAVSDLAVFMHCVRLRQITSRIHDDMSRLRADPTLNTQPHLAVGRIHAVLHRLLQDLDAWQAGCPVFANPSCLYECPQWFDHLHFRERLSAVRRAVDLVPKSDLMGQAIAPPKHMMTMLLTSALQVIDKFAIMSQRRSFVIVTRSYFHMMFNAGLSLMYCVSVAVESAHDRLAQCSRCLHLCETMLADMAESLPDAYSYVMVFGSLRRHIAWKIQRELDSASHEPRERNDDQPGLPQQSVMSEAGSLLLNLAHQSHPPVDESQLPRTAGYEPPIHDEGAIMPSGQTFSAHLPGQDLLQWAFTTDGSIWDMDTILGEYAYGDPTGNTLFDGLNV